MSSDLQFSVGIDGSTIDKGASEVDKKIGELTKSVTKSFEFRDVGRTLATALGINLEKIAENVARWFTGMSKQEEASFKELESVSDKLTETTLKNIRAN